MRTLPQDSRYFWPPLSGRGSPRDEPEANPRPPAPSAAYRPSRVTYWLTVLVAVLMAFASVHRSGCWSTAGSLAPSPPTIAASRSAYTVALQPRRFWIEFVWQSIGTVFLLVIGVFGLWAYRKAQESVEKPKGKRTKR